MNDAQTFATATVKLTVVPVVETVVRVDGESVSFVRDWSFVKVCESVVTVISGDVDASDECSDDFLRELLFVVACDDADVDVEAVTCIV